MMDSKFKQSEHTEFSKSNIICNQKIRAVPENWAIPIPRDLCCVLCCAVSAYKNSSPYDWIHHNSHFLLFFCFDETLKNKDHFVKRGWLIDGFIQESSSLYIRLGN